MPSIVWISMTSANEEAAIDNQMSMTTDEAVSLRYKLKTTVLFNQSLCLKEMSKRMTDMAKELRVHHGIMSDITSTTRQKNFASHTRHCVHTDNQHGSKISSLGIE